MTAKLLFLKQVKNFTNNMDYPTLQTTDIIIPERLRKDHGDIEDFAAGIAELGHLIQPVVLNRSVDGDNITYTLMAGGRRTKALELLSWPLRHGIEYVFKDEVPLDVALEIELAENVERLDMTWQERCMSIWKIHSLKVKLNAELGKDWGHVETGRMLGQSKANVGIAIQLAKTLANTATPEAVERSVWVNGAANLRDAVSRLMKAKEDEGMKHLARKLIQTPVQASNSGSTIGDVEPEYELAEGDEDGDETAEEVLARVQAAAPITTIEITKMLFNGTCFDRMKLYGDGMLDAHILTDPPYGIDMSNIQQQNQGMNVESVAKEHDVAENLDLLRRFIPEAYRVLADKRFMVLFCDMEHFNTLLKIGTDAGFKATRWPIVWVKTHHCQNNCAQYNFTKATEDAIVFRKGDAILARPPQTNWYYGDNTDVKAKHSGHPFVKPAALWTWIASHIALKGQTLYDPFMGEASCGEAVLPMGWNYLGDEINENHYSKAVVYVCDHYNKIYNGKVRFV